MAVQQLTNVLPKESRALNGACQGMPNPQPARHRCSLMAVQELMNTLAAWRPRWRNLECNFMLNCAQKKDVLAIPIGQYFFCSAILGAILVKPLTMLDKPYS
jgi:hypothetical protein